MIDWFDHDNEDNKVKELPMDDAIDLCDCCGGPRNGHLDDPLDGCETCKKCLDIQQLVDTCEQELIKEIVTVKIIEENLKNARDKLTEAERNLDEAEIKIKIRKDKGHE